jgi:hypothetical protein
MLFLRPDGQLAWGLFRPGAGPANLTGTTRRGVKANAHDRRTAHIMARRPFDTAVALGTTRLVGHPIESKSLDTIALTGAMLATIGAKRWPEHINLM